MLQHIAEVVWDQLKPKFNLQVNGVLGLKHPDRELRGQRDMTVFTPFHVISIHCSSFYQTTLI